MSGHALGAQVGMPMGHSQREKSEVQTPGTSVPAVLLGEPAVALAWLIVTVVVGTVTQREGTEPSGTARFRALRPVQGFLIPQLKAPIRQPLLLLLLPMLVLPLLLVLMGLRLLPIPLVLVLVGLPELMPLALVRARKLELVLVVLQVL